MLPLFLPMLDHLRHLPSLFGGAGGVVLDVAGFPVFDVRGAGANGVLDLAPGEVAGLRHVLGDHLVHTEVVRVRAVAL